MAGEIIEEFGDQLESITLVVGTGGRFEVEVDGQPVYSKHQSHRHPAPGEVIDNIKKVLGAYVDGQQPATWQG